ncbi:hypothetical protein F4677DRAFT_442019 [Hypoxylon crocopeplum]|nr:hypothetical protein F4677DRAFT_442019 [Hypoxylon crocopeplum]
MSMERVTLRTGSSMISCLLRFLFLCTLATARPSILLQQSSVLNPQVIAVATPEEKVPGNNNATFCAIPKEQQLFQVEFLDIAPSPIPVDQFFFIFLRGNVPDEYGLDYANLRLTSYAKLADGRELGPDTHVIPLTTTSFADNAHLGIRNPRGAYRGTLNPGRNDVLGDFMIISWFLRTGYYTFRAEATLPDGRHLFCYQMSQWLDGDD